MTDEGNFVLYEIKRFKLNFSSIGKWILQELFRKSSLHPQKLFKTAHSMCLRKWALQYLRQQIQDLRFKINAREILFGKVLENQNLNNITYNFLSKTQCNCILPKVLLNFFQKLSGFFGKNPWSLLFSICFFMFRQIRFIGFSSPRSV